MSLIRFFRRADWDEERAREIEAHVDHETDENIARGMSPHEARHAARRRFGNPTLVREEIYRMNTVRLIDAAWKDLRHGARLLRLNPGFTFVTVLSLALGIGANTAIFQLIDAVRLRPLPVSAPHELADIAISDMDGARGNFLTWRPSVTNPIWERIRTEQQAFAGVYAWADGGFNLAQSGEVRNARALWVSGDFFSALGVKPALGRVFTAADDRPGCGTPGAVVSHAFWMRELGGSPSAVGAKLTLDGQPTDVIGVAPASFFGLEVGRTFDVAVPICAEAVYNGADNRLAAGTTWWLTIGGRLKPGWSMERASAHLGALSSGIFRATLPANYPTVSVDKYLAFTLTATPAATGASRLRLTYADPLWLLLGTSGLVLLIACANLANLMLARGAAREREIAVRLALGASRSRVTAQLLTESLLIAAAGAVAGLFLARELSQLMVALVSTQGDPWVLDVAPDRLVLAFTASVAVLTCLLFGLAPAVRATRTAPGAAMKTAGRGSTDTGGRFGLRRALVVSQLALSLVLLFGALVFARTLHNLEHIETGFRRDGVLIAGVGYQQLNVPVERRPAFRQQLVDRLKGLPGVLSAANAAIVPIGRSSSGNSAWMDDGRTPQPKSVAINRVGPGYFDTLGTRILAGRDFDGRDLTGAPPVAIVNETFARRFAGGANPVGRRFWVEKTPFDPQTAYDIVGLVKDAKYSHLRESFTPTVFFPRAQQARAGLGDTILIRSDAEPAALTAAVTRALAEIDPRITVEYQTFSAQIGETLRRERLMATLSGFFAALAAILAVVGLYGVMSYTVARRRNEIGIRMALGADRRQVVGLVLREALALVALGTLAGGGAALAALPSAGSLVYGLTPGDPAALALSAGVLAAVALGASYLPARRAASLEPTIALRQE